MIGSHSVWYFNAGTWHRFGTWHEADGPKARERAAAAARALSLIYPVVSLHSDYAELMPKSMTSAISAN